jgi:hypothetical protein
LKQRLKFVSHGSYPIEIKKCGFIRFGKWREGGCGMKVEVVSRETKTRYGTSTHGVIISGSNGGNGMMRRSWWGGVGYEYSI